MGERNKADGGVGPWGRKTCDRQDCRSWRRRLGRWANWNFRYARRAFTTPARLESKFGCSLTWCGGRARSIFLRWERA